MVKKSDVKQVSGLSKSIAAQLKQLRSEKGLSLDKVSLVTGVSKAMLGQIERQESSPTIATLWRIATGLNVSFSSFLSTRVHAENVTSDGFIHDPNMDVKTLFPYAAEKGFEVFEITLTHFHEQRSAAHQQGVIEHLHVLEGALSVLQGEHWVSVEVGEQFILAADQGHGYKDERGLTRFINIIYYPAEE